MAAVIVTACGHEPSSPVVIVTDPPLAPTTANATLGEDYVDEAGRLWKCVGKVTPRSVPIGETVEHPTTPPAALAPQLTAAELADKLRPVRLVGGYEYRLAEPDLALAQKILAMKSPPPTEGHPPTFVALPPVTSVVDAGSLQLQYVIGTDDRVQVTNTMQWPPSAFGHVALTSATCTATLIGRTTSLSAAHCFYDDGAWISNNGIAWSANNLASPPEPWGRWSPDSITIPTAWVANRDFDWDFAVVEWGPSNAPGDQVGWMGTAWSQADYQYMIGYPQEDKPALSQWIKSGYYGIADGSRYRHIIDIVRGDSGACAYNLSWACTGIQSTQKFTSDGARWNEVRRWDSTTYNFFDTYGYWP